VINLKSQDSHKSTEAAMPSIFHKRCRHKLIKLENNLHISAITASACELQHAGNITYNMSCVQILIFREKKIHINKNNVLSLILLILTAMF